jgi:capsid protein
MYLEELLFSRTHVVDEHRATDAETCAAVYEDGWLAGVVGWVAGLHKGTDAKAILIQVLAGAMEEEEWCQGFQSRMGEAQRHLQCGWFSRRSDLGAWSQVSPICGGASVARRC